MKTLLYVFVLTTILPLKSIAQLDPAPNVALSDLKFNSVFAYNKKDTLHSICLLGTGFFKAKHSPNSNVMIKEWLATHPRAQVIPVTTYKSFTPRCPGAYQSYCWIVDGRDTLNTYLIRNGCFEGHTMRRPHVRHEMTTLEKEMYGDIALHVGKPAYKTFLSSVKSAEAEAKKNRLGVWKMEKSRKKTKASIKTTV